MIVFNELEGEPIPEHKYRCIKCKYHGLLGGAKSGVKVREAYVFCNYIAIKNERRNSPPETCDKFEEGKRIERKKGVTLI